MKFDARRSRRLRLKRSAAAITGFGRVDIVDLTSRSLGVHHDTPVKKGGNTWIEFTWAGRLLRLDCEIRSCRKLRGDDKFRTGLLITGGFSKEEYRRRVEAAAAKLWSAVAKPPL